MELTFNPPEKIKEVTSEIFASLKGKSHFCCISNPYSQHSCVSFNIITTLSKYNKRSKTYCDKWTTWCWRFLGCSVAQLPFYTKIVQWNDLKYFVVLFKTKIYEYMDV